MSGPAADDEANDRQDCLTVYGTCVKLTL